VVENWGFREKHRTQRPRPKLVKREHRGKMWLSLAKLAKGRERETKQANGEN